MKLLAIFSLIIGSIAASATTTAAATTAAATTQAATTAASGTTAAATTAASGSTAAATTAAATTAAATTAAATTASVLPIYNIFEVSGVMTSGNLAYSADLADNSTVAYTNAATAFCSNLTAALEWKLGRIDCKVTGFDDAGFDKTDVSYTNSVVSSAATNTAFATEYAAAIADPVTAAQFVAQGFTSKSVATPVKSSQTVQAGACVTFNGQSLCGGAGSNMFGALILLAFGRYFL